MGTIVLSDEELTKVACAQAEGARRTQPRASHGRDKIDAVACVGFGWQRAIGGGGRYATAAIRAALAVRSGRSCAR